MKLGRRRVATLLGDSGKAIAPPVYAALAQQERSLASIPVLARLASRCGHPLVVLKSTALLLGGYSRPGWRDSGDVDVLVPEAAARSFWMTLVDEGWSKLGGDEGEADHALPLLGHPLYGRLEIHWCLLGVDLAGTGRSGSLRDASELGLLRRLQGVLYDVLIPSRDLSAAYAVVHGIAQHGFVIDYPYFRVPADLIDLGFGRELPGLEVLSWTSRSLSSQESSALFSLTARLEAGDASLFDGFARSSSGEGRLLRHFVAAGLTPGYKETLRLPAAGVVLSDAPRNRLLARRLWHTLAPPAEQLKKLHGPGRYFWSPLLWRVLRPLEVGVQLVRYVFAALLFRFRAG